MVRIRLRAPCPNGGFELLVNEISGWGQIAGGINRNCLLTHLKDHHKKFTQIFGRFYNRFMKLLTVPLGVGCGVLLATTASAAVLVTGSLGASSGATDDAFVFKVTEDISITQIGGAFGDHPDPGNPTRSNPVAGYSLYLVDYNNNVLASAGVFSLSESHPVWIMTDLVTPLTLHPGTYAFYRVFGDHDSAGGTYDYSGGAIVPYDHYHTVTSTSHVFSNTSGSADAPQPGGGWTAGGGPYNGIANMTYTVVPEPSTFAVMGGLAMVGFAMIRRHTRARPLNHVPVFESGSSK